MYSSENVAKFDGVLVKGNQGSGRKLGPIFKSTEDLRLSPSQELPKTKAVADVKTRQLENPEDRLEEKSYVRDEAVLLEQEEERHLSRKQVFVIILGSLLVLAIGIFSSLLITNKISLNSTQAVPKKTVVIKKQPQTPTTPAPAVSTSTDSQTSGSVTVTPVTHKASTKPATTSNGASTATTSSTNPPVGSTTTPVGSDTPIGPVGSSTPVGSPTGSSLPGSGTSDATP